MVPPSSAEIDPTATIDAVGDALGALAGGSLPDWSRVAATAQVRRLRPGDTLYRQGDEHPFVYVVVGGLLRYTYHLSPSKWRILGFSRAGELAGPNPLLPVHWVEPIMASSPPPRPAVAEPLRGRAEHTLNAVNDCVVVQLVADVMRLLIQKHPQWMRLIIVADSQLLATKAARIHDLTTLTPEQLYLKVAFEEPDVIRACSQRDIASLVGVSPEALSRITSRIRERERQSAG